MEVQTLSGCRLIAWLVPSSVFSDRDFTNVSREPRPNRPAKPRTNRRAGKKISGGIRDSAAVALCFFQPQQRHIFTRGQLAIRVCEPFSLPDGRRVSAVRIRPICGRGGAWKLSYLRDAKDSRRCCVGAGRAGFGRSKEAGPWREIGRRPQASYPRRQRPQPSWCQLALDRQVFLRRNLKRCLERRCRVLPMIQFMGSDA
jgi:hypothetical protein